MPGSSPGATRIGSGLVLGRRHRFRERCRGRTHEPAGGEHVQRPGPLADEVRRRLEP